MSQLVLAVVIFLVTYVLLLVFADYRAYIALLSAVVFVVSGILPIGEAFAAIDWNVLLMIAGTMGTVYFFIESKMPSLMADVIIEKVPNVQWAIVALALFAGVISAFVDNVATVLMVVPVALGISKKLNISPVPSVIAIAIASNLQGAATLVGDTTSILLGGYADMNFLDFFVYKGKMGMFWVVQISAIASAFVLLFLFRKYKQKVETFERTKITTYVPSLLLLGTIIALIIASFLPNMPKNINGYICIAFFIIGIIHNLITTKSTKHFVASLKELDYFTLLLLGSLFVIIAGITEAGVVDKISEIFISISGDNLFVLYTLIVWASVILSAFIDNIPYVATMLPVVQGIASIMGIDPTILYFGLLCGATLGGNLTPIGASANITALGILRKEGYDVKSSTFMKISVPFTLVAVITGYILVWLVWC